MNKTDKIEINGLLKNINDMVKYANKTNEEYVDEKVLKFATEAKKDYIANKKYILAIIKKNVGLFVNLDDIHIDVNYGTLPKGHYWLRVPSSGIEVDITNFSGIPYGGCYNDGRYHHCHFDIVDINWHTSNTDDKRYSTCCWENLVDTHNEKKLLIPLESSRNASDWKYIYSCAIRTQGMNKILVSAFKDKLNLILKEKKAIADTNESIVTSLNNITDYEKVSI